MPSGYFSDSAQPRVKLPSCAGRAGRAAAAGNDRAAMRAKPLPPLSPTTCAQFAAKLNN